MCGIIGIISKNKFSLDLLYSGIKRLEHRGYDSVGVALVNDDKIFCQKTIGKAQEIHALLKQCNFEKINLALGHTRWATHGAITIENAHPHYTEDVVIIHNGIIENSTALKLFLSKNGKKCITQTDTEVIPKLLSFYLKNKNMSIKSAVEKLIHNLDGSFAIAGIFTQKKDMLFVAKRNANLIIGLNDDKIFVTSDIYTVSYFSDKVIFLNEDDYAFITFDEIKIFNNNKLVNREIIKINMKSNAIGFDDDVIVYKGRYFNSWMLKEIFEQSDVVANVLQTFHFTNFAQIIKNQYINVSKITIVACGSSYFSAIIAREWFEEIGIRVHVNIASEFKYQRINIDKDEMVIFVSQSGETADTLAAIIACKKQINNKLISITNVENSSIARASDIPLYINAGHEVGVAATKTFTAQLMLFKCMVSTIQNFLDKSINVELELAPKYIEQIIHSKVIDKLTSIADIISKKKSILYIGRGIGYGLAQEGALKLKELAYIHAEAIAAGELKHGHIALIDDTMISIIIAPSNVLFNKILSNIEEIHARGGKVIAITDSVGKEQIKKICIDIIEMPFIENSIIPIVYAVVLQLISYYTAILKGHDVDRPRNLAKSVTVE